MQCATADLGVSCRFNSVAIVRGRAYLGYTEVQRKGPAMTIKAKSEGRARLFDAALESALPQSISADTGCGP